jgi:hypothetical protein
MRAAAAGRAAFFRQWVHHLGGSACCVPALTDMTDCLTDCLHRVHCVQCVQECSAAVQQQQERAVPCPLWPPAAAGGHPAGPLASQPAPQNIFRY